MKHLLEIQNTYDSTNFLYSDKGTEYCSIALKVQSLVLFGCKVPYYSTEVPCHYVKGIILFRC